MVLVARRGILGAASPALHASRGVETISARPRPRERTAFSALATDALATPSHRLSDRPLGRAPPGARIEYHDQVHDRRK